MPSIRGRSAVLLVLALLAGATAATTNLMPTGAADICEANEILVNPCRPWLGSTAGDYPGLGESWRQQYEGHEARIGRQADVVHGYHPVGKVKINDGERNVVNRGSILYLNWKPADRWVDATGPNAPVNSQIDAFANQIKSLGDRKIMLALTGEPERMTSVGTADCPGLKGSSGSPAEYRAMWANVQDRFDAAGVTNVIWVMNYMGFDGWDCVVPQLWPGNDRIDWVVWDPYVGPGETWANEIGRFYNYLSTHSDADHDYTSKPWGLAEYGAWRGVSQPEAYKMYDDIRASLDSNRFPRLKLYTPFDMTVPGNDIRIGYDSAGRPDPEEQARYNLVAHHPAFSGDGQGGATPTTTTTTTTSPPVANPDPPAEVQDPEEMDHLEGCLRSVEFGLSCFSKGTTEVDPTHGIGGRIGIRSVQIKNKSEVPRQLGVRAFPTPVASTVAGLTYTATAWVRTSELGQVSLALEERDSTDTIVSAGMKHAEALTGYPGWTKLTVDYTAQSSGDSLHMYLWSTLGPEQWFQADDFTLISLA